MEVLFDDVFIQKFINEYRYELFYEMSKSFDRRTTFYNNFTESWTNMPGDLWGVEYELDEQLDRDGCYV